MSDGIGVGKEDGEDGRKGLIGGGVDWLVCRPGG